MSLAALLTVLMLVVAACGEVADATPAETGGNSPTPTAAPEPTPTEGADPTPTATPAPATPAPSPTPIAAAPTATPDGPTLTLSVYFIRDERVGTAHRTVPHTLQVGAAAMEELLAGPTALESQAGLSTEIPAGTELLGLSIANGVATVDLSSEFESGGGSLSMMARLAQVVYTLTQFDTVDAVSFQIEGRPVDVFSGEGIIIDQPVGRADFERLTPLIFVESPAPGDTVSSPLRVWGTANTFEAVFQIEIIDAAGAVVYQHFIMATSGSGTRGTFDETIEFEITQPGMGKVVFFEASARDGSRVNIVEIPVEFTE